MTLEEFVAEYGLARDVSVGTLDHYRQSVACLDRWAGRSVVLDDLTDDFLNRWATWMLDGSLARATVRNRLGAVATLWRAAGDAGHVRTFPRRLKRIRLPPPLPEAWDEAQMASLLAACDQLPGRFRVVDVDRGPLLRAYLLVGWYSGLRMCDLLNLRRSSIGGDGMILIRQQKTGWPIVCKVLPDAVAAVDATNPATRDRIFPLNRRTVYWYVRKLVSAAGINGMPKWLRRASATAVEKRERGAATEHLGHRDPRQAAHYIDRKQVPFDRPLPPGLGA